MSSTAKSTHNAAIMLKQLLGVKSKVEAPTPAVPVLDATKAMKAMLGIAHFKNDDIHEVQLQTPSVLGPSEGYDVLLTGDERGRMWFVRLGNLHWNVAQPLLLEALEREWNNLQGTRACLCGDDHNFEGINVYCIQALQSSLQPVKYKALARDTMWENITQADPNLRGKKLLSDHLDICNIDKLYFVLTAVWSVSGPQHLRDLPAYKQYLVAPPKEGGLITMRNFASHERRSRTWDCVSFRKYADKASAKCLGLARQFYAPTSEEYKRVETDIRRCLTSTVDLEMERLVFELACRTVSSICLPTAPLLVRP
jgi:hypothetical protein